jgi:hypothetical protein
VIVPLLPTRRSRRLAGIGLTVVLLTLAAVTGSSAGNGASAGTVLAGDAVPADQVSAIARAALSCPTLTAARVAAQLMAASGFRADAVTPQGGSGVAGLTDAQWQRWVPWPGAVRHDPAAETSALAHLMCDLVGRLRSLGLTGDLWKPALAAHQSGIDAVRIANGVPADARDYVRKVSAYANWYGTHDALSEPSQPVTPGPAPTGSAAPKPVPGNLVSLVVDAGKRCPQVTAPRIAGQLMAASGFDADLLGSDGGQGIAQFLPTVWSRYSHAGQSPWDPAAAIPTMAAAMCSLTSALTGLTGDPYPVALASFAGGPLVASATESDGDRFADRVLAYAAYYARDPRLAPVAVSPAGSDGKTAPNSPGPVDPVAAAQQQRGSTGAQSGSLTATHTTPAKTKTTTSPKGTSSGSATARSGAKTYEIQAYGDKCIDVPSAADGTQLQIWTCTGAANQKWTFAGDGSLRSEGLCMDLAWASSDNGTKVQVATCNGGWAQHFYVNSSNDLVNPDIGKCVDITDSNDSDGAPLQLWDCAGSANQKWTKVG